MQLIDTHAHLYLPEFDNDRDEMMRRTIESGVIKVFLPNIDTGSIGPMLSMAEKFPGICYPMMGLHPTSVKEDYQQQLSIIEEHLRSKKFIAVGEVGIDLYWDRSFSKEQAEVFSRQIELAIEMDLPLVIHCRESFDEIFEILEGYRSTRVKGVFHSFTGNLSQARRVLDLGFYIGIGGIVTFKNSSLDSVIAETGTGRLLLETDSPYLAPSPNRGKRNESSYLKYTAGKISQATGRSIDEVASLTTNNAIELFNIS